MFRQFAIATVATLALAAPLAAQTAPGNAMLSQIEGVEPGVYSIADLERINQARRESSQAYEVNYILENGQHVATRSGNLATGTSAGAEQLARQLNVNASDFTLPELVQLDEAVKNNDTSTINAITQAAGVDLPAAQLLR